MKLPAQKMKTMGQTLRGDFEGGVLVWEGGSLGPVGSPGWRRRESAVEVVVKVRGGGRKARLRGRRERVGRGIVGGAGVGRWGVLGEAKWAVIRTRWVSAEGWGNDHDDGREHTSFAKHFTPALRDSRSEKVLGA